MMCAALLCQLLWLAPHSASAAPKAKQPARQAPAKQSSRKKAAASKPKRTAHARRKATVSRQAASAAAAGATGAAAAAATETAAAQNSASNRPELLARCGFTPASRRHLFSRAVYVVDEATGTELFSQNADIVKPIASVSKLMMAMVWLDHNKASMRDRLEITEDDLDRLKFSHSRLRVGSKLTRADMLHIALMSSENRAASALSRDYPGGRPAFIDAMNAKAQALGMGHTHFINATGLSPENVSTARELANMVRAANRYALIQRYSVDKQQLINTGVGQLNYINSNRLVRYGKVHASLQKTGFIDESGHNMVMRVMVHDRRPVIMTMLDSDSGDGSRLDGERIAKWLSCSLK